MTEARKEYQRRYYAANRDRLKARLKNWRDANADRERIRGRLQSRKDRERRRLELAGRPKPSACELCGDALELVFDHDHVTGKFRGWICNHCNRLLGAARDKKEILEKAIEYLIHR